MWVLVDILGVGIAYTVLLFLFADMRGSVDLKLHGCAVQQRGTPPDLTGLTIAAPTSAGVEFEVRPQRWLDEFATDIGLSSKGEVGKPAFDRSLYLRSDDPYVLEGLRFDPELPALLRRLFDLRNPFVGQVERVVCRDRTVRVDLRTTATYSVAPGIIDQVAKLLVPLARRLDAADSTRRPDPVRERADRLIALARALAVNGAAQFLRLDDVIWTVLGTGRGLALALALAAMTVFSLVFVTLYQLARTSRAHVVLAEVLSLGALGAMLTAIAVVHDLGV